MNIRVVQYKPDTRHPKNNTKYKTLDTICKDPKVVTIWDEGDDGIWIQLAEGWNNIPLDETLKPRWYAGWWNAHINKSAKVTFEKGLTLHIQFDDEPGSYVVSRAYLR